jgi:hypothetical protein
MMPNALIKIIMLLLMSSLFFQAGWTADDSAGVSTAEECGSGWSWTSGCRYANSLYQAERVMLNPPHKNVNREEYQKHGDRNPNITTGSKRFRR